METSFSFRFIKLGVALGFLLLSAILPGTGGYLLVALGGILLMTAFASFGNFDSNGTSTKTVYKVFRYSIAVLLMIIAAIQIYVQFLPHHNIHFSIYASVVDVAIIAYLLMFKPSNTSKGKKILKVIGYVLILLGVNALQNCTQMVHYLTYSSNEISWGAVFASLVVMALGTILLNIGGKKA